MTPPVTKARIAIAGRKLQNADVAAVACREAGLPFFVACALLEKESSSPANGIGGGANIYGHDAGGVFSTKDRAVTIGGHTYPKGSDIPVTAANFFVFLLRVLNGETPNGVGPCQITYAGKREPVAGGGYHRDGGHFAVMAMQGLRPWVAKDGMVYGFSLLADGHREGETWEKTYARYNGGPKPNSTALVYGRDFAAKVAAWHKALGIGKKS